MARLHFEAGTAYFDRGEYEEAIEEWEEAYELSRRAPLLLNISNAQERIAQFAEAAATLERFLASGDEMAESNRMNLQARVETLRQRAQDAAAAEAVESMRSTNPYDAAEGEPAQPPAVEVTSQRTRWYRSWWFWTIVGVVVAGGVVTAAVVPNVNNDPEVDWEHSLP